MDEFILAIYVVDHDVFRIFYLGAGLFLCTLCSIRELVGVLWGEVYGQYAEVRRGTPSSRPSAVYLSLLYLWGEVYGQYAKVRGGTPSWRPSAVYLSSLYLTRPVINMLGLPRWMTATVQSAILLNQTTNDNICIPSKRGQVRTSFRST